MQYGTVGFRRACYAAAAWARWNESEACSRRIDTMPCNPVGANVAEIVIGTLREDHDHQRDKTSDQHHRRSYPQHLVLSVKRLLSEGHDAIWTPVDTEVCFCAVWTATESRSPIAATSVYG